MQADYNANETARRLYVHANTLAYRLRTIRRLLGGDPARGDLRLTVELALKLSDLTTITSRASPSRRNWPFASTTGTSSHPKSGRKTCRPDDRANLAGVRSQEARALT